MAEAKTKGSREPARYSHEDKRDDVQRIFTSARRYHAELREIHHWFTPFRGPTTERASTRGEQAEGAARTQHMFDGTGPSAAFAFVSNMKADWLPAFQDFFLLQCGPLFPGDADARSRRNVQLQALSTVVHQLTAHIRATATEEMFADLFGGTGAMILQNGTKNQPIVGYSVPTIELAMGYGAHNQLSQWGWKRRYTARNIEPTWPKADIPPNLWKKIKDARNEEIEITQFTWYDWREDDFVTDVWSDEDKDVCIWSDRTRTSPWITPRVFVVPGETMGRGFAHLGLPFVKTVNKARELALRAAAFALLGLWTRRNDGVFNPKAAAMVPGAMWKVASNGGNQGPSIARLDVPHNFDISTVVIRDEREQIRRVLLDDELPDISDKVRSPTEIMGRARRYERTRGGATTRFAFELVVPFVQRSVDILEERGLLEKGLTVDNILTQALVTAPAAAAQRTGRTDRMASWVQIMTGLVGPRMAAIVAKMEEILPEIGRDMGVDEKFIRAKLEVEHLKELIDGAVQEALKQAKGLPAPVEQQTQATAADFANGAAH